MRTKKESAFALAFAMDEELVFWTACPFCEEVYWDHDEAETPLIQKFLAQHIEESHISIHSDLRCSEAYKKRLSGG